MNIIKAKVIRIDKAKTKGILSRWLHVLLKF
jgi:hypothetical protein